jgi:hypothetical protein
MPSPDDILASLTAIAVAGVAVAIAWHAVLALAALALAAGWRPSRRLVRGLLLAPLVSVAIFAFVHASPFNGVVFAGATLALATIGLRRDPEPVRAGPAWAVTAGLALVAYAWIYPHFLPEPRLYLIAAPLGLVPCPTLAVLLGVVLVGDGLGARAFSAVLAGLGLFYGLFGALRLGVWLDLGLLAGALLVVVRLLGQRRAAHRPAVARHVDVTRA